MCGIAGILNSSEAVELNFFNSMVDALISRGPDGRGVKVLDEGKLCLGHRRLSIIDLSEAGNQPMSNEDQSIWLTFNGEIYNYRRLRRELEGCGHVFQSQSDSETIVHAYEEWGRDCVQHFRGIFAFAIYDGRQKSLFLARDHVGVKPLYYYHGNGSFIFASQPRSIIASGRLKAEVDHNAFTLYLSYGNVPGDVSIYMGIKKLLPGHWILFKDGKVNIQQYWKLTYTPKIQDAREAEEEVRNKINECVQAQAVSDVPIGTLLSGGVDSTIITSILSKKFEKELSTYTIGFDEKESDEREYASFASTNMQTRHHEHILTYAEACTLLTDIIEAYDEPFHLNGLFPFLALSRLVKSSRLKVVLGGDGGDELFAGYLWYEYFNNSQTIKREKSFLQRLSSILALNVREKGIDPIKTFFRYNGFLDRKAQKYILGEKIKDIPDCYSPLKRYWRPDLPCVLAGQFLDFNCFLVDHCLTKVDRASMACGVEVRVPFLDLELVELIFSIDHKIIFENSRRKALLRRAMQHELPSGLDTMRKKGFSSPLETWLANGISKNGENLLLRGSLCSRGLLNGGNIKNSYYSMNAQHQLLLISAELWSRFWLEGDKKSIDAFSEECINYSNGVYA